ncbi:MAG: hypothetical protein PHW82_00480 [Bacteroidales bacterium]|nr:hypothetical protein [Bacteroidales bacterium]
MTKQISIDQLNNKLFETIEMLQNNSDPNASECEKISVENAKGICEIGKVVMEGFKTQAQVLHTVANAANPQVLQDMGKNTGVLSIEGK